MPEQKISLNTLGPSGRAGSGKAAAKRSSCGDVAVRLSGGSTNKIKRGNKPVRSASAARKTTAPRRVGSLGTGRAGGNPRASGAKRGVSGGLGGKSTRSRTKASLSRVGVRINGGGGSRSYTSRGVVGAGRVNTGSGKAQSKSSGVAHKHNAAGSKRSGTAAGKGRSGGNGGKRSHKVW